MLQIVATRKIQMSLFVICTAIKNITCRGTYNKSSKSHIEAKAARSGVQRMVDVVCHVEGEQPVVRAVLEEIPQRHGSM